MTLAAAIDALRPRPDAVFARDPLIDSDLPDSSDLDLLVFADVPDLITERLRVDAAPVDLLWVPAAALDGPERFARQGLMPHRLLQARLAFDAAGRGAAFATAVHAIAREPTVHRERLANILNFGADVVREIGVTWDFPALARFWLQMARSACLAVMIDARGGLCPNVYTRPLPYLRALDREGATEFTAELDLDDDVEALIATLGRMHTAVRVRCPAELPEVVRAGTRAEYRYFASADELAWRIGVAREMAARADAPSAVAYLRFWAYVLARIPMVHAVAMEGRSVSFLRPEREVRPALAELCPEILDDLTRALSGRRAVALADAARGLDTIRAIHQHALGTLREIDLAPTGVRAWQPFRPAPDSRGESP